MKKDNAILYITLGIISMVLFGNVAQLALSRQEEIIEGNVIDAEYIDDEYLKITFDNGNTYNISFDYNDFFDLTVHSKLILKIQKTDWWLWPNVNDVWIIRMCVKVPDNSTM